MRIGYGRIYPTDSDPEFQFSALSDHGCLSLYIDDHRQPGPAQPRLTAAIEALNPADVLVTTSLDRLATSSVGLIKHVAAIDNRRAHLHVLDQDIDTTQDPERVFFRTIAAVGNLHEVNRGLRVRQGVATSAKNGRKPGRPRIEDKKLVTLILDLVAETDEHGNRKHSIAEIARRARVSRATVYRYIDRINQTP